MSIHVGHIDDVPEDFREAKAAHEALSRVDRLIFDFADHWDARDYEPTETPVDVGGKRRRTLRRLSADCCERMGWKNWRLRKEDRERLKEGFSIILVDESEVLYFKDDDSAGKAWEELQGVLS